MNIEQRIKRLEEKIQGKSIKENIENDREDFLESFAEDLVGIFIQLRGIKGEPFAKNHLYLKLEQDAKQILIANWNKYCDKRNQL